MQHMAAELANEARKRAQAEARVDEFYRVNTLMQAQTVVRHLMCPALCWMSLNSSGCNTQNTAHKVMT
jgi:hypothetical protein